MTDEQKLPEYKDYPFIHNEIKKLRTPRTGIRVNLKSTYSAAEVADVVQRALSDWIELSTLWKKYLRKRSPKWQKSYYKNWHKK